MSALSRSFASSSSSSSSSSSFPPLISLPFPQKLFLDIVHSGDSARLRSLLEAAEEETEAGVGGGVGRPSIDVDRFHFDGGRTALHQSCHAGNLELVKVLICHGADARLATRDGWHPLHIAVHEGHLHIVRFLLDLARNDPRR